MTFPPGAREIPDPEAEAERLAELRKQPPPDAPWQCPGCRTYYSHEVRECRCEADKRSLSDRIRPQPPIRLGAGTPRFPPEVTG